MKCLGLLIINKDVDPLKKQNKSVDNLSPPTNHNRVRKFVGLVNYNLDISAKQLYVL